MNKILVLPLCLMLFGCATVAVPVTATFPDAPDTLQQQCSKLTEATVGMSLSQYTKTVVDNYMLYHECERKVEGWHSWYAEQKHIFEEAAGKKPEKKQLNPFLFKK